MENNFLNKTYKYVEKTTSFSYDVNNINNYETNINIINSLIKKNIKVEHIIAIESNDFGEAPVTYDFKNLEEFINAKEILVNRPISKVIDFCKENDINFEIHVMPDFSKIDVIFGNYRKENNNTIDQLINDSIKTR